MAVYTPNETGRCPHCLTVVRFEYGRMGQYGVGVTTIGSEKESLRLTVAKCPQCGRVILTIEKMGQEQDTIEEPFVFWPLQGARPAVPTEVPEYIANDYREAALLLRLSPKASAALSRRCLQAVLREAGDANQKDLSKQIDAILPTLPGYIARDVDAIRNVGNFAAHPMKNQADGLILEVEPGEAEWNLDVLDELFDFYYVRPNLSQEKRNALNAKLQAANKPPMK